MKYRLFADDLSLPGSIRDTERTRAVIAGWAESEDVYESEFPSVGDSARQAVEAYWNLTAERIIFRTRLIGEDVDPALMSHRKLRDARPFGPSGPKAMTLLSPDVRIAMAYVPLASQTNDADAVLTRLYCVKGLKAPLAAPPFVDGCLAQHNGFSWFLAGNVNVKKPIGKSWQLAADLLMRALNDDANRLAVTKSLVKGFVVTGALDAKGRTRKVSLIGKKKLAFYKEFKNLTWLVPADNLPDADGMKAEGVATAKDGWEHLRAGQSKRTADICKLVKDGIGANGSRDLAGLLVGGADPDIVCAKYGKNARQMVLDDIIDKIIGLVKNPQLASKPEIDIRNEIVMRLSPNLEAERAFAYYGDKAPLLYMAARRGDTDLLRKLAVCFNIDATDRDGETALDFAVAFGETDVERFLRAAGAGKRGIYESGSRRMQNYFCDFERSYKEDSEFLFGGLKAGIDPLARIDLGAVRRVNTFDDSIRPIDPDPWNDDFSVVLEYRNTSVLQEAVLARDLKLVKACVDSPKFNIQRMNEEDSLGVKYFFSNKNWTTVQDCKGGEVANYRDLANRYSSPLVNAKLRCLNADDNTQPQKV